MPGRRYEELKATVNGGVNPPLRGINTGKVSDKREAEMCAKGVIFGGFGREKGGQKGVFGASKVRKKAFFCVPEG